MCHRVCGYEFKYPWRPGEGVTVPKPEGTGSCEPSLRINSSCLEELQVLLSTETFLQAPNCFAFLYYIIRE